MKLNNYAWRGAVWPHPMSRIAGLQQGVLRSAATMVIVAVVLAASGCAAGSAGRDPGPAPGDFLFRLSDDTRTTFAITPARLDSIQLFLDGDIAYDASTMSLDQQGRVSEGMPHMEDRRRVLHRRIELEQGTPGVVVASDFGTGTSWSFLDIDFGGLVVRFEAGYGGRVLDDSDGSDGRRPVLYYAPADELEVDGLVYRLDRRTYTGAALAFHGIYRYHETRADTTWALEGRTIDRAADSDTSVVAANPPRQP